MGGTRDLVHLLKTMEPELSKEDYVYCSVSGRYEEYADLNPIASFVESEGLTLILTLESARKAQLSYLGTFKRITLTVHSSLEAVGLTAAVATQLTNVGISANVVAAYYHDHIFVQREKAAQALTALEELSK